MDYLGTTFLHGPLLSKQYDEYVLQRHEFWAILATGTWHPLCRGVVAFTMYLEQEGFQLI